MLSEDETDDSEIFEINGVRAVTVTEAGNYLIKGSVDMDGPSVYLEAGQTIMLKDFK